MNLHRPLPPLPRKATLADLNSLVELENDVFSYDQIKRASFKKFIESSYLWVCEIDLKIVGYILVLKRKGSKKLRIYSLAVTSHCRGMGLGKLLLEFAIKEAKSLGLQSLKLEVKVDNHGAMGLYETLGFNQVKRLEQFYSDGTAAYVYLKKL